MEGTGVTENTCIIFRKAWNEFSKKEQMEERANQ